jgi:hypothetical protein
MNRRLVMVVVFAAAVAAVGIALGLKLSESTKLLTLPTTGSYAPIGVPTPLVPTPGVDQGIDPDSEIREGTDLSLVLGTAGAHHEYRLTVTNISGVGTINSFNWVPPANIKIVKVLSSSIGSCAPTGLGKEITCTGVDLKRPSCSCSGDGGKVVITFVANQRLVLTGLAQVVGATPALDPIPSTPQPPDVAACKPGETSTKAHPCTSG